MKIRIISSEILNNFTLIGNEIYIKDMECYYFVNENIGNDLGYDLAKLGMIISVVDLINSENKKIVLPATLTIVDDRIALAYEISQKFVIFNEVLNQKTDNQNIQIMIKQLLDIFSVFKKKQMVMGEISFDDFIVIDDEIKYLAINKLIFNAKEEDYVNSEQQLVRMILSLIYRLDLMECSDQMLEVIDHFSSNSKEIREFFFTSGDDELLKYKKLAKQSQQLFYLK